MCCKQLQCQHLLLLYSTILSCNIVVPICGLVYAAKDAQVQPIIAKPSKISTAPSPASKTKPAAAQLLLEPKSPYSAEKYTRIRQKLIETEEKEILGGDSELKDPDEVHVNKILMIHKRNAYDGGPELNKNGAYFISANHFFHTKTFIEGSNIFKIIKMFPKGAALHIHDTTSGSLEFVARNLSTWSNLYFCTGVNQQLFFRFFSAQPEEVGKDCESGKPWTLLKKLRQNASSDFSFNKWLVDKLSMVTSTPERDYTDINRIWEIFESKISSVSGIVKYEDTWRVYIDQVLQEFYDDNVMYVEMRSSFSSTYRLNRTKLNPVENLALVKEVSENFKKNHPDFWGVKYIYTQKRFQSPEELNKRIDIALELKKTDPDFVAGFDLVGQEERGTPLLDYLPQLLKASAAGLKFFFHAGETSFRGTKIDENLFDAILLNTSRIGHGYALRNHPKLLRMVKEKQIAIELCPISNQVLGLVKDFRNHPGCTLLRSGFPLVISSDDPGTWGTKGISYDWYIAFMIMAGQRADLRFLKQLAINSIVYSAMSKKEKKEAMTKWNGQWKVFLRTVVEKFDKPAK